MASNKSNFRKCTRGGREWNSATLRDGALAGDFSILKRTTSMTTCKELCCANDSCELALLVNGGCFSVQCKSAEACMPQSVKRDGVVAPRIFVRNIGKEANYFFHISQRFLALNIRVISSCFTRIKSILAGLCNVQIMDLSVFCVRS